MKNYLHKIGIRLLTILVGRLRQDQVEPITQLLTISVGSLLQGQAEPITHLLTISVGPLRQDPVELTEQIEIVEAEDPLRPVIDELLMGHRNLKTTERYVHLSQAHLQDAVAVLDNLSSTEQISEAVGS